MLSYESKDFEWLCENVKFVCNYGSKIIIVIMWNLDQNISNDLNTSAANNDHVIYQLKNFVHVLIWSLILISWI